jgi:hypothetical protein
MGENIQSLNKRELADLGRSLGIASAYSYNRKRILAQENSNPVPYDLLLYAGKFLPHQSNMSFYRSPYDGSELCNNRS